MEDNAISLQVVYGSVGVTARIDGTPYSPDVFDDLVRRCVNGVLDVINSTDSDSPGGETEHGYKGFVTFMEARMQDDD